MILTVIDTETTGLEPETQEIIEVAFISYVISAEGDRYITKKYEAKIKPEALHLASEKALEVNGYSDEEWAGAPDAAQVLPTVCEAISKSNILLGQNLIFDLRFIESICKRNNLDMPEPPPYIDTKAMADVLRKNNIIKSSGMDYLCEHYQIQFSGRAHTALADCERTMMAWDALRNDVQDYDLYTFDSPYEPY